MKNGINECHLLCVINVTKIFEKLTELRDVFFLNLFLILFYLHLLASLVRNCTLYTFVQS